MFISQPPCGDACVIGSEQQAVTTLPTSTRTSSADAVNMQPDQLESQAAHNKHSIPDRMFVAEGSACMPAISTDVPASSTESGQLGRHSRTLVPQDSRVTQQEQQPSNTTQEQQHITGPLKDDGVGGLCRKPGRGDRTLSMSCSDKLARWALLGVQVCLCGLLTCGCIKVCRSFAADGVCMQCWASHWMSRKPHI